MSYMLKLSLVDGISLKEFILHLEYLEIKVSLKFTIVEWKNTLVNSPRSWSSLYMVYTSCILYIKFAYCI